MNLRLRRRAFAVTLSGAILAVILFLAEIGRFHAAGQVTTVCKHSQQIQAKQISWGVIDWCSQPADEGRYS